MIRPNRSITTECPMCRRARWTREVRYSLLTEEERGFPITDVKNLPEGFEAMDTSCGASIYETVKEAIEYCKAYKVKGVGFDFNEKTVLVTAKSNSVDVVEKWWKERYGETQAESFAKR
jgi:hypothetical protein